MRQSRSTCMMQIFISAPGYGAAHRVDKEVRRKEGGQGTRTGTKREPKEGSETELMPSEEEQMSIVIGLSVE